MLFYSNDTSLGIENNSELQEHILAHYKDQFS